MSGCSYDQNCPRCGGEMSCYSDSKPFDQSSGICLECGLSFQTEGWKASLEEVNAVRQEHEMEPLTALRGATEEWLKSGLESIYVRQDGLSPRLRSIQVEAYGNKKTAEALLRAMTDEEITNTLEVALEGLLQEGREI